jgi:hypothetical protein
VTVYEPVTIEFVSNRPASLVVKDFDTPVSTFVTITVTPGMMAPEVSVTVPRMSPEPVLCPKHAPLPRISNRGRTHRCKFDMELPPEPDARIGNTNALIESN